MATREYEDARIVPVGEMPVLDTSKIPTIVSRALSRTIYDAVTEAFRQPGVQEDYLHWKAARDAKKRATI